MDEENRILCGEMLQFLRSQSGASAGGPNTKDLQPRDDNDDDDDDASSVFTDTYTNSTATETNTMSDTYTQASSSKNHAMTSPNIANMSASKRLNFATEGKKQETSDAYRQSQKAMTPAPQTQRGNVANAVPNRVQGRFRKSSHCGACNNKVGYRKIDIKGKSRNRPEKYRACQPSLILSDFVILCTAKLKNRNRRALYLQKWLGT